LVSTKRNPVKKKGTNALQEPMTIPTMSVELIEERCPHYKAYLGKPLKTTSKIFEKSIFEAGIDDSYFYEGEEVTINYIC